MNHRRELRLAVLLVLLGAGLLLLSAGRVWLTGTEVLPAPLPSRDLEVDAGEIGSPVGTLALVVLAGVPALAATRSTGRVVVGVLLALAGVAAGLAGVRVLVDPSTVAASSTTVPASELVATGWPAVAVVGGVLTLTAGGLVAFRGRRWAQLARRYEAPASATPASVTPASEPPPAGSAASPVGEAQLWEALDRGEDPTRG